MSQKINFKTYMQQLLGSDKWSNISGDIEIAMELYQIKLHRNNSYQFFCEVEEFYSEQDLKSLEQQLAQIFEIQSVMISQKIKDQVDEVQLIKEDELLKKDVSDGIEIKRSEAQVEQSSEEALPELQPFQQRTMTEDFSVFQGVLNDYQKELNEDQVQYELTIDQRPCVIYLDQKQAAQFEQKLVIGETYCVKGLSFKGKDAAQETPNFLIYAIQKTEKLNGKADKEKHKRIELHAHTGLAEGENRVCAATMVEQAALFQHDALALVDKNAVNSFAEAYLTKKTLASAGRNLKLIYGVEVNLIDDGPMLTWNTEGSDLKQGFVAFDVETTGFDAKIEKLIEVAAVKFIPDGQGGFIEAEHFMSFVNPGKAIPKKIISLTGIKDADVQYAADDLTVLQQFKAFVGSLPMVAHNAFFDLSFLRYGGFHGEEDQVAVHFNPPLIDTLNLARKYLPQLRNHKLDTIADYYGIQFNHHRADDDARVCGEIFIQLFKQAGIKTLQEFNLLEGQKQQLELKDELERRLQKPQSVVLLAKDYLGLYHLYKLVCLAATDYYFDVACVPKSVLDYYRLGLIVGSSGLGGQVFQEACNYYLAENRQLDQAMKKMATSNFLKTCAYYDYFELLPVDNQKFMLANPLYRLETYEQLQDVQQLMIGASQLLKKLICAVAEPFQLQPKKEVQAPASDVPFHLFYFQNTKQLRAAFSYLGEAQAERLVVANTQKISEEIRGGMNPVLRQVAFRKQQDLIKKMKHFLTAETAEKLDFSELEAAMSQEFIETQTQEFEQLYYLASSLKQRANSEKLFWESDAQTFKQLQKNLVAQNPTQAATSFMAENQNGFANGTENSNGDNQQQRRRRKRKKGKEMIFGNALKKLETEEISEMKNKVGPVQFEGLLFNYETRLVKSGNVLHKFYISDFTDAISCTFFSSAEENNFLKEELIENNFYELTGDRLYDDNFEHDYKVNILSIKSIPAPPKIEDQSEEKRIELHIHSKMSAKEGLLEPEKIVAEAARFGHPAVAITDRSVVQGYPAAAGMAAKLNKGGHKIKLIYGMEGYLVEDGQTMLWNLDEQSLEAGFISLQLQMTPSSEANQVIQTIAAVAWQFNDQNGWSVRDTFEKTILPETSAAEQLQWLQELNDFVAQLPWVAFDALEQLKWLRYAGFKTLAANDPKIHFNPGLVDIKKTAQVYLAAAKDHTIEGLCQYYELKPSASLIEKARLGGEIFLKLYQEAGVNCLQDLAAHSGHKSFEIIKKELKTKQQERKTVVCLVQNTLGLYHLYRLVSHSHMEYFEETPCIPRSVLDYYRDGLILGSAGSSGEVYQEALNYYDAAQQDMTKAMDELETSKFFELCEYYDYLEIQPPENQDFLIKAPINRYKSLDDLKHISQLIIKAGIYLNKMVCATSDAYYLEAADEFYWEMLLHDPDADMQVLRKYRYFRTTDQMFEAFAYLDAEMARKVVIDDPMRVAALIEPDILPFPWESFPPHIPEAADIVKKLTYDRAMSIYGQDNQLPDIVAKRLEKELHSIIDNGFSVMYYIAHEVVKKSNDDGYIVGSRGSVGSSLVATLCEITEVNPLMPHYICPTCNYSEFDHSGTYGSGFDLPAKSCPNCQAELKREGQNIPFETFLGFDGDKQPDIDLNFSGFYQPRAHQFIEQMFGADHTFRAGTISGYAEKNAQSLARDYLSYMGKATKEAELARIAKKIQGVKRTTGQHPGGIVVLPKEREIYDFTPIQYPADKKDYGIITTHFDFRSMHDTLLKLDILGHDDPSMLKMLGDITGVDVTTIPLSDEKVMSLFAGTEALGIDSAESVVGTATIGLPEMGTLTVRDMIKETHPKQFYDLVQLSGLSHGTDVWQNNARDLIQKNICTINDVIGCRDSIMTSLIQYGLPNKDAFDIMEQVRKGKSVTDLQEDLMLQHQVPKWYIESCKKIKYMFPKAHAVAYLISALRIAWFKVYHPEAYYSAFFTIRFPAPIFDSSELYHPQETIFYKLETQRRSVNTMKKKDQEKYYLLELVAEMMQRNIQFLPVDLMESEAETFFSPKKGYIKLPLNALPGVSAIQGENITEARQNGPFKDIEDLKLRAKLGNAPINALRNGHCLDEIPESAQLDLFSLL